MAVRPLRVLSLCAGVGGLELGLRLALGDRVRVVGYVERDAFAAALLVARMEDKTLEAAPVWDDVATFDGRPWRGAVDILSAGFPCQPFSAAGKRKGKADERWLWPDIERVIREVEPEFVFLENVPGVLGVAGGIADVLGSLAALGFDAEWTTLGAGDLGAPHRRNRVFILAHAPGPEPPAQLPGPGGGPRGGGGGLAHPEGARLPLSPGRDGDGPARPGPECGGGELPLWPPGPDDAEWWARVLALRPDLAPALPRVRGVADGVASRVDRLRALGNGVVPVVAAVAFLALRERLEGRMKAREAPP